MKKYVLAVGVLKYVAPHANLKTVKPICRFTFFGDTVAGIVRKGFRTRRSHAWTRPGDQNAAWLTWRIRAGQIICCFVKADKLTCIVVGAMALCPASTKRKETDMSDSEPVVLGIILSDLVIQEQGTGKISLIGCFNNYNSNRFPFVSGFFVTVILTNLKGKIDQIQVTIRIENQKTGFVLTNVAGGGKVKEGVVLTGNECIECPLPVPQCVFQTPDVYSVVVLVNGDKIGSRPFLVGQINPSIPPTPA